MKIRTILFPTLSLTLICLFTALALSLTNRLTKDQIAMAEREAYLSAAREVLVADTLTELARDDMEGFVGTDAEGRVVGYVFKTSAKGYGGAVSVVVGLNADGSVVGVAVDAPDETPGLGKNVEKSEFLTLFVGKNAAERPIIKENIDGVTGATYSSRAVAEGVSLAITHYETLTKGD